ncbi:hypothetical protein BaRGS_00012796, partial [Batillaria attramentaria]
FRSQLSACYRAAAATVWKNEFTKWKTLLGGLSLTPSAKPKLNEASAAAANFPNVSLTATVSQEHGSTLSVTCKVDVGSVPVQYISVGKIAADTSYWRTEAEDTGRHANIGIDGHIDTAVPSPSFLRVDLHKADCRDNGPFYCNVTTQGSYDNEHSRGYSFQTIRPSDYQKLVSIVTNASVCDDELLQLKRPDVTDPSHFTVTCSAHRLGSSVSEIDYIEIRRNQLEMIAFANISETSMQAQAFDTFKQPGVVISGGIDQSNPLKSKVMVDFRLGSCEDFGTFFCRVLYKEEGSEEERYIRASQAWPSRCVSGGISLRSRTQDPTSFSLTCDTPSSSTVSGELSVVLDVSPDTRFEVAAFDGHDAKSGLTVYPEFLDRGFKANGVFTVATSDGTCNATGLYRCKMMKWSYGHVKAKVAEVRLPACKPGASVHVGGAEKVPNYRGQSPAPWDTELRCSLEASDVHQLISLEISTITNHTRESIVAINAFLNKQQPVRHSTLNFSPDVRDVAFAGRIHIFNATSSYLSIITRVWLSPGAHEQSVLITCTAVYASSSGSLERSMADVVATRLAARRKKSTTGHGRNEQDDEGHEKGHDEKEHGEKGRVKEGDDKKQQADGRGGKDEEKAVDGGNEDRDGDQADHKPNR